MKTYSAIILIAMGLLFGCAGGISNSPFIPADDATQAIKEGWSGHNLWGLWQFAANPDAGTLEFTRLRTGEVHVNVIPFLEPPAGKNLKISNLVFDGNICGVDVTLTHPFPGLPVYTGFDVAGIFISRAENPVLVADTGLSFAGEGDTRLLNPDGYTRWWNPSEFSIPGPPIMRYKDGLLGVPDSSAGYNCTLNGYRMFGDDLNVDNDILDLGPTHRNQFSQGYSNTRHYTIDFSGGVIFNYAVDANWEEPEGPAPYTPDDFPSSANRPEPWAISVTVLENTLYNDGVGNSGGELDLAVDAWVHFNNPLAAPVLYIPALDYSEVVNIDEENGGVASFEFHTDPLNPPLNSVQLVFVLSSEVVGYWDVLPDDNITGYFTMTVPVGGALPQIEVLDPNGGESIEWDTQYDVLWTGPGSIDFVDLYYSKDDFVTDINLIEANVPNTETYDWLVPMDESATVKIRIEESGGGLSDDSDNYFEIFDPGCQFSGSPFTLAQDYQNVPGVWSHTGILCTGQDAVQRIIGHSWPFEGAGGIIKIYNASNPLAGPVATYDTGDLIYCNNDQAMWIDKHSESGYDRIIYNNFGGGSTTPGYQLKTIDWDGSTYSNPEILNKLDTYGVWSLCVSPNGDIYMHNAYAIAPSFYFYDKSNGYAGSFLFQLQQSTCDFGAVGNIREMVYDPELDCLLIFCNNTSVSLGGQLFALDLAGNLVFEDTEVFPISSPNIMSFRVGIDIDLESPYCRLILYGGEDLPSNTTVKWHFARYSGELDEKELYVINSPSYYGPCRGDLDNDGNLWASPHSGTAHFYKFTPPVDW